MGWGKLGSNCLGMKGGEDSRFIIHQPIKYTKGFNENM